MRTHNVIAKKLCPQLYLCMKSGFPNCRSTRLCTKRPVCPNSRFGIPRSLVTNVLRYRLFHRPKDAVKLHFTTYVSNSL